MNNLNINFRQDQTDVLYSQAMEYASGKQLTFTALALCKMKELIDEAVLTGNHAARYENEFIHSLEVCIMLIDLHIPVSASEEDILLGAAVFHIYPELFNRDSPGKKLKEFGFCNEIIEIIDAVRQNDNYTDEEQADYYDRIRKNKLALLISLADRGNIIQRLYLFSTWNAHRYINETKVCYYPMCIYGKEHYHELLAPISILKEKIKSLLEMEEILLSRYEARESELIQDILALQEENATIKGIISKFKGQVRI